MNAIRQYQILIDSLKDEVLTAADYLEIKKLRKLRNKKTVQLNKQKRKQYERTTSARTYTN